MNPHCIFSMQEQWNLLVLYMYSVLVEDFSSPHRSPTVEWEEWQQWELRGVRVLGHRSPVSIYSQRGHTKMYVKTLEKPNSTEYSTSFCMILHFQWEPVTLSASITLSVLQPTNSSTLQWRLILSWKLSMNPSDSRGNAVQHTSLLYLRILARYRLLRGTQSCMQLQMYGHDGSMQQSCIK